MATPTATPHVEFGMYPFSTVAWAWDELWAAVHARAPWTPPTLTRSGDVHARWYDLDCVVTHICGWPFAALHHCDHEAVGAFEIDLPEALPNARYRSVLLSPHDTTLDQLVGPGCHAVANSADSLSGWLSLRAAVVEPDADWPGTVTFTSAHLESVRELAAGRADLAAIDSWSLAFIEVEHPELTSGLYRVGLGPVIPTPVVAARTSLDPTHIADLRAALDDAVADVALRPALAALHVSGFAHLTLDDYVGLRALAPPT